MELNLNKLSTFIELVERRNTNLELPLTSVRGISNTKEIMFSKARVEYAELKKFYIVKPGEFAFNPRTSRNGEKIGLVLNNTSQDFLFTFNDIAFRIKEDSLTKLLPEYLFLFFKKESFDKYARYHSWGSATELFTWNDMQETLINVPTLETQKRIISSYKSIDEKIRNANKIIEELKRLIITIFIETFKNKQGSTPLEELIVQHKKSKIQVSQAVRDGKYPFYTSGQITIRHNDYLIDGLNLYLTTGGKFDVKIYNGKAAYSTDTWAITALKYTEYLYAYFISNLDELDDRFFDGSALKHLKKPQILKLDIYKPTDEELLIFNKKISPIIRHLLNQVDCINYLEKMRNLILKTIF